MTARPRRTDGVRAINLELENFLSHDGVDICLLNETLLNPGLANYARHCTDRQTAAVGTAILVRRGIVHHLEATAIQVSLEGKPVIDFEAYLSPSRQLIVADLTACFGGRLPVFLAGDLNAKHVNWTSRLSTRRRKLIRDYANENPCPIFGPVCPTTNPY